MKRKSFLWITTVFTLLLAAFWVGSASATGNFIPSCFTDTNAPAACWMKLNGFVTGPLFNPNGVTTRILIANWLQRLSQIPPTSGLITISDGFGNWRPFTSADNVAFTYYSSETQITKATVGPNFFSLQPAIPTVFYGRSLLFRGVELCYTASATTSINYVEINTYTHSTGKIGVMVELLCETDFVAKNEEFIKVAKDICLQVAAMNPKKVNDLVEMEFIKDPTKKVKDLVTELAAKFGENIKIGRFERFEI